MGQEGVPVVRRGTLLDPRNRPAAERLRGAPAATDSPPAMDSSGRTPASGQLSLSRVVGVRSDPGGLGQ